MELCKLALYIVEPLSLSQININHAGGPNTIDYNVFVCLTLIMVGETNCLWNYL